MSDHLDSVAQYIENTVGALTIGVNLFIGFIPQKRPDGTAPPDDSTIVLEAAGGGLEFDLIDRADKMVQVITRSKDYITAKEDAFTIFDLFHGNSGLYLPPFEHASGRDYVAMTIEANSLPMPVGEDDANRWRFSTNYIVRIRE